MDTTEDTSRPAYPKMLYRKGEFSGAPENQLTVANEEEELAAFEQDFCQLVPMDKKKPKDSAGKAKAAVAAQVKGKGTK